MENGEVARRHATPRDGKPEKQPETQGPEGLYQVDLALWKETWHRNQCVMESIAIGRTEGCCSQEQESKLMVPRPPFLL